MVAESDSDWSDRQAGALPGVLTPAGDLGKEVEMFVVLGIAGLVIAFTVFLTALTIGLVVDQRRNQHGIRALEELLEEPMRAAEHERSGHGRD